jgi:hypothetical protein
MSQGGYIRIEIANGTFDDITISVPVESTNLLYAGSKVDLYDTMYDAQMEVATKQLNSASKDAVNYIFITDIHNGAYLTNQMKDYESSAEVKLRAKRLIEQMTSIVKMANADDNIDFIAVGGDIINGYETPNSPLYKDAKAAAEAKGETLSIREFVISQMQEVLAPLKLSEKPVFVIPGNHDDNRAQSLHYNAMGVGYSNVFDEVISDRDWNNGIIKEFVPEDIVRDSRYTDPYTGEEMSKYYYYDIQKNGKTTRVVCLDIFDHRYAYDENGSITSFDTETGGIGYSVAQLQWVAQTALAGFEGNLIFLSHTGIDSETCGGAYGEGLREILTAFNDRTVYNNPSLGINVDYTTLGDGKVMSFQGGHKHSETYYFTKDAKLWQIISGTASVKGSNDTEFTSPNVTWQYLYRNWRGEYEACFDIMSVSDEVIYKLNIGAGYNKKLLMPE